MGLTFATCCVDCAVESPEIGDFGYIGRASLEPSRRKGGLQNFGYIYEGFRALSILTPELETFRAFLEEHDKHRLVTYSDQGAVEGELDELPKQSKKFRGKVGRFKEAAYQLVCGDCNEVWCSPSVARFRAFRAFRVSREKIELFKERVWRIDSDNFYRVGDALLDPDDELGSLAEFVDKHKTHSVTASLVGGPTSAIPPALL